MGAAGLKNVACRERGQATDQELTAKRDSRGATKEAAMPIWLAVEGRLNGASRRWFAAI